MLDGGRWQGKQLLSRSWVSESTTASERANYYGYLWWIRHDEVKLVLSGERHRALAASGYSAANKLKPLVDRPMFGPSLWMELGATLSSEERGELGRLVQGGLALFDKRRGKPIAFAADGWLGQALIVSPAFKTIAVRQHRKPKGDVDSAYNQLHGFFSFGKMLKRALQR